MEAALQMTICGFFLLFACFFIGKKIGQRKSQKIREDMKALELSFSQLLDQIELTFEHNLKVMDSKTSELKEILPLLDKKVIHIHDLLQETNKVKNFLPGNLQGIKAEESMFAKLRRDTQDLLNIVDSRLMGIEQKVGNLEIIEYNRNREESIREKERVTTREFEKVIPLKAKEELPFASLKPTSAIPQNKSGKQENLVQEAICPTSAGSASESRSSNVETTPFSPQPGTPHHDVLTLYQKGVTLPEIARQLRMGHGEVQLIISLFGARLSLRKVV